jgi:hypothetical protein
MLEICNRSFPRLYRENHSLKSVLHTALRPKTFFFFFLGFHAFPMPFSKFEVVGNACALFLQTIRYKIEDCT